MTWRHKRNLQVVSVRNTADNPWRSLRTIVSCVHALKSGMLPDNWFELKLTTLARRAIPDNLCSAS